MQDKYQHGDGKVQYDRSHGQPDALHGVKANERLFGIGLYQQKDDGGNEGELGNGSGGVVSQAALRRHVAHGGGSRSCLGHLRKAAARRWRRCRG
jgi:hypothetical protein